MRFQRSPPAATKVATQAMRTSARNAIRGVVESVIVGAVNSEVVLKVSQTVSIVASAPLVNTENGVKGDVMVSDEILQMPLISRAVTDLAYLTPGVVQNTSGVGGAS